MTVAKTPRRTRASRLEPEDLPAILTAEARNFEDYVAAADAYARAAVADKRGRWFCKPVRLACQRYLNDLKRAKRDKDWPFYFDRWHANDPCDFIEKLPHVEGRWATPTIRLRAWKAFVYVNVYGWRRKEDGGRRFSMVYEEEARKNAKSTSAAGVSLYGLTCEDEPGAQVYIGATTGAQAGKVFAPSKKMVERTPDLREAFGLHAWARSITCDANGGYIKPINAKSSTQDGHNPHVSILDELHAHRDRGLFDVMRSAEGARSNPLLWMVTTAGYFIDGVCYEQRTLAMKILEGLIEADHYFAFICTLDEGDDEFDERVWIKSNPNLFASVNIDSLRRHAAEARASPESHAEFKTKKLNVWTTAKSAHVNITLWKKCNGPVDLDELEGVPCWGAFDLAATSDLTSFRLVWKVDDRVKTWGRRYMPEDVIPKRSESVPFKLWAEQGLITATPGNVTDYAWIERDIVEAMERFDIQVIAYDPWNASHLVSRLADEGVPLVEFRQGIQSYAAPMKEMDRLYTSRRLDHAGDPVLAWCASNVVVRRDENDNMAPSKKRSLEKIDDYTALVMAVGVSMAGEGEPFRSMYEDGPIYA